MAKQKQGKTMIKISGGPKGFPLPGNNAEIQYMSSNFGLAISSQNLKESKQAFVELFDKLASRQKDKDTVHYG